MDEPDKCASGGNPLHLCKILHLLFFPLVQSLCALCLGSQINYKRGLDAGPLEFKFLRWRGYLTNPLELSLCFRVTGKKPHLISRDDFV